MTERSGLRTFFRRAWAGLFFVAVLLLVLPLCVGVNGLVAAFCKVALLVLFCGLFAATILEARRGA